MKIQINSDRQVGVNAAFIQNAQQELEQSLARFGSRITRLEVHLSDINSASKSGSADKRCFIEARPAGEKPVVVSHDAATADAALRVAANKLKRLLTTHFGKEDTVAKRANARPAQKALKKVAATKAVSKAVSKKTTGKK